MSKIQSVLIEIDKYTLDEAISFLINHNLNYHKVDIKDRYFRFRQFNPSSRYHYITKEITDGIKFIIAYPKGV